MFNEFNVVLQSKDGGYVVGGYTIALDDPNLTSLPKEMLWAKVDRYGNVMTTNNVLFGLKDSISNGIALQNGEHLLLSSLTLDTDIKGIRSICLSAKGEWAWSVNFDTKRHTELCGAVQQKDGSIWLLTNKTNLLDGSINIAAYKLSANGHQLGKLDLTEGQFNTAKQVVLLDNGQLQAIGLSSDSNSQMTTTIWTIENGKVLNTELLPELTGSIDKAINTGGSDLMFTEPMDKGLLILHKHFNDTTLASELSYHIGSQIVSLKNYFNNTYLLGINTTNDHISYFYRKLEIRSVVNDSLLWTTDAAFEKTPAMMYDVIVTADSGFAVVGMQDVPGKGSKAFIHKLPKPDIFGSNDAF